MAKTTHQTGQMYCSSQKFELQSNFPENEKWKSDQSLASGPESK